MGDTMNGCKRGRWCLFSSWERIVVPDEHHHPTMKNVMECLIDMNHIPTTKNPSESIFSAEGSGPWMTAIEHYGSTLDGYMEGNAHQAGEDIHGRYLTGNEDFLPGDVDDQDELLEEVSKDLHPDVRAALADLVFNQGCRIISIELDATHISEGIARDVIIRERKMGGNSTCPCFLHPALVFVPSFSVLHKLIEIKMKENRSEAASLVSRVSRNIENDRGNLRKLLSEPTEMEIWITIKMMVLTGFINKLKKKGA